jgi:hypothetical protein
MKYVDAGISRLDLGVDFEFAQAEWKVACKMRVAKSRRVQRVKEGNESSSTKMVECHVNKKYAEGK